MTTDSDRDGYLAMVEFLRAYIDRAPGGSFATLLADVEMDEDGLPHDAAMWADWLNSMKVVRTPSEDRLDVP